MSDGIRNHPLTADEIESVWRRFLAAVTCGPREQERLCQVESDERGATIWLYMIGERAGDFAFRSVHEAEAFDMGLTYKPRPAMTPTTAPPGPSKVAALAERVSNGESLWHPDDKTPSPLERLLAHA